MDWEGHDAGSEVLRDDGVWSGGASGRPWWRSNQQGADAGALGFVGCRRGQLHDHGGEAVARDAHDTVVEAGSMSEWSGSARRAGGVAVYAGSGDVADGVEVGVRVAMALG